MPIMLHDYHNNERHDSLRRLQEPQSNWPDRLLIVAIWLVAQALFWWLMFETANPLT